MSGKVGEAYIRIRPMPEKEPLVAFVAHGLAQPAGSKVAGVTKAGRAFTRHANDSKQRPWRTEIARAAAEAFGDRPLLDEALELRVTFFRPRPKSHFKASGGLSAAGLRNPYPTGPSDCSKLVRCLEDAIQGVVVRNDSQFVRIHAAKVWGEPAKAMVEVYQA